MGNRIADSLRAAREALRILTFGSAKGNPAPVSQTVSGTAAGGVPGVVFGDPKVLEAAHGLVAGATPYGLPPLRGSRELMIAQKRDPWLNAVTTKIADAFITVPWRLFVARDTQGKPSKACAKAYLRRRAAIGSMPAGVWRDATDRRKLMLDARREEGLEEVSQHYFLDLLDQANPTMTGPAASWITQIFMDLQGEAFWILERNAIGLPVQYWPVPPYWVYRTPFKGQPFFHMIFGTYQAHIPERDVIWMKHLDPENPYGRGAGRGMSLADEIDTDEYASKTMGAFFYNQAVPPYIVSLEGAEPDVVKQAEETWNQKSRGWWQAMKMHWTNVKMNVEALSPTFADQKIIELKKYFRDTKVQAYGVPPEIVGIHENANRATIDVATFLMAEQVMKPRLEQRRTMYQTRILPEFDEALVADFDSPTPDDRAFKQRQMGAFPYAYTINEIRRLSDDEPIEGPDGEERPPMPTQAPTVSETPVKPPAAPAAAEIVEAKGRGPDVATPGVQDVKASKAITEADVPKILEALRAETLSEEIDPIWKKRIDEWAADALASTGAAVSFELLNPIIARHLKELAADHIEGLVDETTRQALRDELVEGVKAGEGIDLLADRVHEIFAEAEGYRAERIARTEVLRSSNFASTAAYEISGVVPEREWVSTPDDRVRETHDKMDGQRVAIDEPFTLPDGGGSAMYPGDFGLAEEDINCRCTTAPIIQDPGEEPADEEAAARLRDAITKTADRVAFWKRFDRRLIPWETGASRALRRGFRRQAAAVLKALRAA